ncbi:MAG: uroporphyrinogen decarboxylase family protein [Chloroflexota bacterium]
MKRDEVFKAIQGSHPAYVPIYYFNQDQDQSDLVAFEVQRHFIGPDKDRSEWGFTWNRMDETMGQPTSNLIDEPAQLADLAVPNPFDPERFKGMEAFNQLYPDRFRMASLALSGFTTMSFLRGFKNLMLDLVEAPKFVEALADVVFGFEEKLIKQLPPYRFDAVAFFDDWGTQRGMLISPAAWRKFFKPRYLQQFALAHRLGLKVYFHCCGYYPQIIPDLIEIGVDLLNISQPNLYDIPELGQKYGGKVCFVCPVSYQTTSISGTRSDIFAVVQNLFESFGCFNGGLIGYVEEYHSIGLSQANYQSCVDAFKAIGHYQPR